MIEHFKSVVEGFSDTLPIISKQTGNKGKGQNKLETLATNFQLNTDQVHNAIFDVILLEQVILKLNISSRQIVESTLTWNQIDEKKTLK